MEYTKEAGEKSTVKLTIRFTEEEWQEAIMAAYKKVRGKYTVPGFRKGKAPKPVLENYYGKGVFFEDAIDILYSEHYYDILEAERDNFLAIDDPQLSLGDMKEGEGIELIATVPVRPEIDMDAYTGLSIRKYDYKVTDADIAGSIAKALSSRAGKAEVTDRPAKYDDTVNIDFKGFVGLYQFPGGSAEGYDLVLGSGSFIPGFEDQVVGMSIGETKDVLVKFPDDYQGGEDLAGKDARFEVKVNSITEKVLPDLTDDFVKANLGCDTVEEYKIQLRTRLEKQAEEQSKNDTENSVVDELVKHVQGDIPDVMVEREMDSAMQRYDQQLQMYQGFSLDDYLKYMKQDKAQFRENFRTNALNQVKASLAIQYIIKKEDIKATDEDLEAEIAKRAAEVDKKPEDMSYTDKQKDDIRDGIVIDKFLQFMMDNNDLYTLDDSAPAAAPAAEPPAEE
ncbi:MAG: trigger factor [Clostridia bacterium]|nr:trigger factor [Clostridia bacterium]